MESIRILVVEDEPILAELISDDLCEMGYQVFIADNGRDALDFIKKQEVDIVLSDLNMPHMSGSELIMELLPVRA